jgi:putative oxidoreductase
MLNGYTDSHSIPAYGPAILRLVVGAVFVAHGAQKLFGVWGGGGLTGTAAFFAQLGLEPAYPLAVAAATVEFGGGLLLIVGAYTLFASLALIVQMLVAIWTVHLANGFFLPNGYEFNLTLIGALACLALTGPGALSIDARRA